MSGLTDAESRWREENATEVRTCSLQRGHFVLKEVEQASRPSFKKEIMKGEEGMKTDGVHMEILSEIAQPP